MSRPQDIPALTSIRGIAAWWVVLYHFRQYLPAGSPEWLSALTAHGYLAVDLFFILSGFVLALNYAESFRISLAGATDFYRLRFARIYPLHFVMLMLFLLNPLAIALFSASGDTSAYGWDYFVLSLFLVQNWGFSTELAWNDPAWSISTEVFAYLFFPFAAMLMGRVIVTVGAALLLMAALLMVLALAAQAVGGSLGYDIPGFGLTRCCLQFLLGMLVWRLRVALGFATPWLSHAAILLAAILILTYMLLPIGDALVMPAAFALLVFGLADPQAHPGIWLNARWLETLGLISYSTYLSHVFIKIWVKFALVRPGIPQWMPLLVYLVLVALASIVLYRMVEVPGRRWLRGLTGSAASRSARRSKNERLVS
jgi:peptidoglycan/LPS O-acetylase OafA/YrhL